MIYQLGVLAGGIGLFLLGMRLMTDGLRVAAGSALRDILARGTRTTGHGILSGALITAIVQSSSAVTVATLGFVNAGLMGLSQAIAVILGANVGTTMTGWLIALVGLKIDVGLLALPVIGLGMGLRLVRGANPGGALGEALAGFGVFFLGIDVLAGAFEGLSARAVDLAHPGGVAGVLAFVGLGFLLTVLTQSSSAAIALVLTGAAGGVLPLNAAAAAVIGANVGTTVTAVLGSIGATANARRVAMAHVGFNLGTAVVALALLPLLLHLITGTRTALGLDTPPVTLLAAFHTTFNVIGVLLFWPLAAPLAGWLAGRFRSADEDEARPHYLDRTVLGTPVLAMHALTREMARTLSITRRMAAAALSREAGPGPRLAQDRRVVERLVEETGEFCRLMNRAELPAAMGDALPVALRVLRYGAETAELAVNIANAQSRLREVADAGLAEEIARYKAGLVALLTAADPAAAGFDTQACMQRLQALEQEYQELKSHLLRAGASGRLPVRDTVAQLDLLSDLRRLSEQVAKGARHLADVAAVAPPAAGGDGA
jgi:phosphate:Na+ symporter